MSEFKSKFIVVEGAIGAGKTSLVLLLSKKFNTKHNLEVVEENPFLSKFYNDIERYDFQGSNLIQMLLDVQAEYNWLPKHALYHIGDKLDVPLTRVYNIASFYKFFNLEPRGKHSIVVCTGTACHVRGSMSLLQRIVNVLDVKPGDTTEDMKFTLDTVNCLGVCALGPVMMLDKQYYSDPSISKLKKIFSKFE